MITEAKVKIVSTTRSTPPQITSSMSRTVKPKVATNVSIVKAKVTKK